MRSGIGWLGRKERRDADKILDLSASGGLLREATLTGIVISIALLGSQASAAPPASTPAPITPRVTPITTPLVATPHPTPLVTTPATSRGTAASTPAAGTTAASTSPAADTPAAKTPAADGPEEYVRRKVEVMEMVLPYKLLERVVPQTVMDGNVLKITYLIPPQTAHWVEKYDFKQTLINLVPDAFKKYPSLDSIRITAAEPSEDITGQAFASDVLRARFSRAKSRGIAWSGASSDNIAQLADEYWQHPILER
jgi:hypothetical protein